MSRKDQAEVRRTGDHYDRIASQYDDQVDGLPHNRAMRDAFRQRVAALVQPGGTILDFGCGTGIDAAWYAARGYRVIAYDISPAMVVVLRARCEDDIAQGRIVPVVGELSALEESLQHHSDLDGVAANFAVLYHIRDLEPLFDRLGPRIRPGAPLVASLLSPFYQANLRRPGWWRVIAQSLVTGRISLRGMVTTYRHYAWKIRRMGRRWFDLAEVVRVDGVGRWTTGPGSWRDATRQEFFVVDLRRHR
jgi:SAM-dependent methyltransferase